MAALPSSTTFTPQIADEIATVSASEAARHVANLPPSAAAALLEKAHVLRRNEIFQLLPPAILEEIFAAADPATRAHWETARRYPEDTIGRVLEPPIAVFSPETHVSQAIAALRILTQQAFITYAFTVDPAGRLLGVIVMRELLLADAQQTLAEITLRNPFFLTPELEITDAMKRVLHRHYPVYPVCSSDGILIGLVRGSTLFEAQAVELSAQAGSMVGVDKEERFAMSWQRSLALRHPWLQLNLFTGFIAATVVGTFEGTLQRIVLLAVFLPVMMGQSGNTGSQALAVALRAMTLGELTTGKEKRAMLKEAILGFLNGALVGVTASVGMFFYAKWQHFAEPFRLGAIVFVSMTASCLISGILGVLVPVTMKKMGADPATASIIFLTTATDVVSMGLFLGLAALFL